MEELPDASTVEQEPPLAAFDPFTSPLRSDQVRPARMPLEVAAVQPTVSASEFGAQPIDPGRVPTIERSSQVLPQNTQSIPPPARPGPERGPPTLPVRGEFAGRERPERAADGIESSPVRPSSRRWVAASLALLVALGAGATWLYHEGRFAIPTGEVDRPSKAGVVTERGRISESEIGVQRSSVSNGSSTQGGVSATPAAGSDVAPASDDSFARVPPTPTEPAPSKEAGSADRQAAPAVPSSPGKPPAAEAVATPPAPAPSPIRPRATERRAVNGTPGALLLDAPPRTEATTAAPRSSTPAIAQCTEAIATLGLCDPTIQGENR